jgi:hypothetical protein
MDLGVNSFFMSDLLRLLSIVVSVVYRNSINRLNKFDFFSYYFQLKMEIAANAGVVINSVGGRSPK